MKHLTPHNAVLMLVLLAAIVLLYTILFGLPGDGTIITEFGLIALFVPIACSLFSTIRHKFRK